MRKGNPEVEMSKVNLSGAISAQHPDSAVTELWSLENIRKLNSFSNFHVTSCGRLHSVICRPKPTNSPKNEHRM